MTKTKRVHFSNRNLVTYINMDAGNNNNSKTGFIETLIYQTKPKPFIFNTGLCDKIVSTTFLNTPTQLPKLKTNINKSTRKYTQKQTAGKYYKYKHKTKSKTKKN